MAGSEITTYKWAEAGDIAQVNIRKAGGRVTAYLYTSENAPHLHQLREIFKGKGWTASSDMDNGKPVLRLIGLQNENDLIDFLQHGGYAQGQPQITNTPQEKAFKLSSLKSDILHTSGAFFMLGDALMIVSGLKHGKNLGQLGTGFLFGAGDIAFTAFGGHHEQVEFTALMKDLKGYLHEQGIKIPQGAAINTEIMAQPGGFLEHVHKFVLKHVNSFKIIMEVLGGLSYLHAGMAKPDAKHPDRVTNHWKTASGSIIVTGWASALLIKEKKLEQEKYEKAGTFEKIWMKIQSSPLSLAGGAGLIHNALTITGAFRERSAYLKGNRQKGSPHWKWDMLAITAGMIPANILFAMSKKKGAVGEAIDNNSLTQDVYGIAVQIIEDQPRQVRDKVFNAIVDFLASRSEIKGTKAEIASQLQKEMEDIKQNNPWFIMPSEQEQISQAATPGYQEKVLAQKVETSPVGAGR